MHQLILIIFFIVYYIYTIFVFYKLEQNLCSCKKLENFKKMWQFKYVKYVTPFFLLFNLYAVYKYIINKQFGGNNIYYQVMIYITLGYVLTFINDYAILSLFSTMKNNNCPCQEKHRTLLNNLTYGKLSLNILIFIYIIMKTDKKLINKIIKKNKNKK